MRFYYNYPGMEHHAVRIERELPELIQAGNWEQIAETVKVPEDVWAGPAADSYREACRKIVEAKDAEAIQKIPQAIRGSIRNMQEKDAAAAAMIQARFASF